MSSHRTPLLLGIDTGGTFTDAVLFDDARGDVVAAAKAPTTHDRLEDGIAASVDAVLAHAGASGDIVEMVSLSSTLATNALVEGRGRPVAAVLAGFDAQLSLDSGLGDALGGDPLIAVAGGHDPHGVELAPLDLATVEARLAAVRDSIDAVAVTAHFAVRNPVHEQQIATLIRERFGLPVTCSHELSAQLNGPKRAVTATLNARLIALIDELVVATQRLLMARSIRAPLMVVRGDGSLVSAEFVRHRPIETILSGPAASMVGASFLSGRPDAVVVDIGGTTTDVGVLRDGAPLLSTRGALVGGHATMVAAAKMRTVGLGGDSHVRVDDRSAATTLLIGPRRVVPLCRIEEGHRAFAVDTMQRQLRSPIPHALDATFVTSAAAAEVSSATDDLDRQLLTACAGRLADAATLLDGAARRRAGERLLRLGLLRLIGFTPTDASLVVSAPDDASERHEAAALAAQLVARQRTRLGVAADASGAAVAQRTLDTVVERTAREVLAASFEADGLDAALVDSPLVQRSSSESDRGTRTTTIVIRPSVPVVGVGASAHIHHPPVGHALGVEVVIPPHAEVANAVGAVVGAVRVTIEYEITAPEPGVFLLHCPDVHGPFTDLDELRGFAESSLRAQLSQAVVEAGAATFDLDMRWSEECVDVGGHGLFVSGRLRGTATGRPPR
jgi:N-methylhydantoinase A/oxoprolinase/acetone carboxylase beta subunit